MNRYPYPFCRFSFFFWRSSLAVLGPWAKAHGCGAMQTGGLKPLFAIKMEKNLAPRKTTTVQPQPQRKIPSNEGMAIFSIA